jgi:hypothetical protein
MPDGARFMVRFILLSSAHRQYQPSDIKTQPSKGNAAEIEMLRQVQERI